MSPGFEMILDRFPEFLSEQDGHSVSDLARHGSKATRENEIWGESLEAGGFPDAQCAVLCRVPEASIGKTDASGRQCACGTLAAQAAVDVCMPLMVAVARWD